MNDKLQLVVVIVAVAAAVAYFIRHIYLLTKREDKCGNCPISGSCAGRSRRQRFRDGDRRPPCCR